MKTLDVRTLAQWRAWLKRHHATESEIWMIVHKRHTGTAVIPYLDALDEALCFGWIDSLVKRIDDDRFARKYTPRRPDSNWSAVNRKRWAALDAAGRLAAAGRAASPTSKTYAPKPHVPVLPGYIATAFQANEKAWQTFQSLSPTYRRNYVAWIHTAKRPETREKRIRESIALLAAGKKLGLK
jgi:uncharacterized protein YdeI (YjbR/CyaY-like superfamily)